MLLVAVVIVRAGTVPDGFRDRCAGVDCSPLRRFTGTEVKGISLRWRAMRRRAEQEDRKYVCRVTVVILLDGWILILILGFGLGL
jgi:hypothetical protein